jgi:hypothetical protein
MIPDLKSRVQEERLAHSPDTIKRRWVAFRRPIRSVLSRYLQSGQTGPFVVKLKSRVVALLPL